MGEETLKPRPRYHYASDVLKRLRLLPERQQRALREAWENQVWAQACEDAEKTCLQISTILTRIGGDMAWQILQEFLEKDDSHLLIPEEEEEKGEESAAGDGGVIDGPSWKP